MNFETIKPGDRIKGLIPGVSAQIISSQPLGDDTFEVYFRKNDGSLGQQVVFPDGAGSLSIETEDLPWKFDADAAQVKLTSEVYRIKLAHLFDPHLAVHTSLIDPLCTK